MELAGLSALANRKIHELSGGQQQRVAIARALVIEPQMLLLDEPMSNLDVALRVKMREEIRAIQQKIGITTLFITHDQQEALAISDKIAVMQGGKALQIGTPKEVYNHPNSEFVANFVGVSNRMDREDGTVEFIRPERMRLMQDASENAIEVRVKEIRFSGMYYEYVVEAGDREYRVVESNRGDVTGEWKLGDTGYLSRENRNGV